MEKDYNGHQSEYSVAFKVIGEPAIIINGLPNLPPDCKEPFHVDASATNGSEADGDPCFGELLEGRQVKKMFGNQFYYGKVVILVKHDKKANWYRVVYEDGDLEDLWWHELEEVLLPLDISIPLEALALQWCKKRPVLESVDISKVKDLSEKALNSSDKTSRSRNCNHSFSCLC